MVPYLSTRIKHNRDLQRPLTRNPCELKFAASISRDHVVSMRATKEANLVKLRKAFALILSGVILTSPVVVGQNSQNVECPTMTFSTAEIVYGPEGLSKVAPINAGDNQVLSDFLSTRKEWDDRFANGSETNAIR